MLTLVVDLSMPELFEDARFCHAELKYSMVIQHKCCQQLKFCADIALRPEVDLLGQMCE